jgi:biofilm protein TabA
MIIDQLKNWRQYHHGDAWECTFEFLLSLTPDTEEKKYMLRDDRIFARVMSYETKQPEDAVLEAHRKYVDIQAVLVGAEGFECFPADSLGIDKAYDDSKDVEFYKHTEPGPVRIDLSPGTFLTLFPQDAHMPGLILNDSPEVVKKVVVKIDIALLK